MLALDNKKALVEGEGMSFAPSFLTILVLARKHQRRVFDLTCVFCDPLPEKSVARLHTHTPCPLCLDWFSERILEGITAICKLLRNKGGSSLSSLQYFRGITWPDKHALALLYTCSLFCLDRSPHPNCALYFKAEHVFLSYCHAALWTEATCFDNCSLKKIKKKNQYLGKMVQSRDLKCSVLVDTGWYLFVLSLSKLACSQTWTFIVSIWE